MSGNKDPDPKRFEEYEPLPDGTGFRLKDGKIFKYEEDGGWFDEYGNHYNANGEPDDEEMDNYYDKYQPKDIEYDELVNAYENDDYEEVDAEYDELYKKVEHEVKINKLISYLDAYEINHSIIIEFENMNFKAKENDIRNFFLLDSKYQNKKDLFTVEIDYYDGFKKTGFGRIKTHNKEFAKECLTKYGQKLLERPLFLNVENPIADLLEDDEDIKIIKIEEKKPDHKMMDKSSLKAEPFIHVEEKKEENKENIDNKVVVNNQEKKEEVKNTIEIKEEKIKETKDIDPWDNPIVKIPKCDPKEVIQKKPMNKSSAKYELKKK